jgi:cytosine/adenosine deaminase-related metal-dependent hydrolase
MGQKLFTNVMVFDGSGSPSFSGEVVVQGNRIKAVAKGRKNLKVDGAEIVDGGGASLMPGLTEAHAHLSFTNCVRCLRSVIYPSRSTRC